MKLYLKVLRDSYVLLSVVCPCWLIIKVIAGKSVSAGINPAQPVYQRKHSHSHTHTQQLRVSNQPNVHVLGLWEETQRGFSHICYDVVLFKELQTYSTAGSIWEMLFDFTFESEKLPLPHSPISSSPSSISMSALGTSGGGWQTLNW